MNEHRQRGLGRGLSALLGDAPAESEPPRGNVREIDIAAIRPNPQQPRRHFAEEAIAELAESIATRGVLQPILVRDLRDGHYELVAGERRWRASQRARLHKIPAIVREFDAAATAEVALIENIQREDLNALEEADAYARLIDTYGHTQEALSGLVGKSRSHVANLLRLRDLPEFVQQSLMRGELNMGHARAIATAENPEALAKEIIAKDLSVRQAEQLAKAARPGAARGAGRGASTSGAGAQDADVAALERQLGDVLGLRVKIAAKGASGTVSLNFSSLDQLDLICQRLSGEPI
ncbi:ParB/RepB/Spo0J family partition protein [Sphingomonas sp. BN140010]|uniref:ParB/RepB/Spo0J family partition protein n=1 Tax=Sphingomonas arvum TaxID=2992113 RepID=A0ABT3JF78_9SPHN|nr:ParB/RepB/Spo0J family partition protein [Sphingomonas sp. BN140010]MCW3797727.1 ParB/RepB/Spo0J family partition protein [Sphingomonas sp. BN140010]